MRALEYEFFNTRTDIKTTEQLFAIAFSQLKECYYDLQNTPETADKTIKANNLKEYEELIQRINTYIKRFN